MFLGLPSFSGFTRAPRRNAGRAVRLGRGHRDGGVASVERTDQPRSQNSMTLGSRLVAVGGIQARAGCSGRRASTHHCTPICVVDDVGDSLARGHWEPAVSMDGVSGPHEAHRVLGCGGVAVGDARAVKPATAAGWDGAFGRAGVGGDPVDDRRVGGAGGEDRGTLDDDSTGGVRTGSRVTRAVIS